MNMPSCLCSLALAHVACVKRFWVWWMWLVLMHKRPQSSCTLFLVTWIPDRDWCAKRGVTFAVDGPSNLVRGASVSTIENKVFDLIWTWLVLMATIGEACHVLQRKLMPCRLLALLMLLTW